MNDVYGKWIWNHASFKNNLRIFSASNKWKFKNIESRPKKWHFYEGKKKVYFSHKLYSMNIIQEFQEMAP